MVGENTEEIEWFAGEVNVKTESTVSAAAKTATLMMSILSITIGLYLILAAMGGTL